MAKSRSPQSSGRDFGGGANPPVNRNSPALSYEKIRRGLDTENLLRVAHDLMSEKEVREMTRIEKSIEIKAPVENVFEFVADWHNTAKFYEGIYDLKPTTEARGEGARFIHKAKVLGIESETEYEVSDFVENEGWTSTSVRGIETKVQWIFASLDDGTKVTHIVEYKPPIPIVGVVVDALLVKRQWETNIQRSLQNLKRLLED